MQGPTQALIPASSCAQGGPRARDAAPFCFPAHGRHDRRKSLDNLSRSYRTVARRVDGAEWSTLDDLRHFFASHLAR